MNMRKIELLAPAGSLESLYAAVQAGADAVYLGGSKFSARAYASNFDEENMTKAVDYCHLYNVKVYITINTLIKENEMQEAIDYVKFLYNIGVDAIIIQDIGLAHIVRENFPDMELHASTQMTIHNGEGALFLKELGFSRIVLSRELSIDEIKHISLDLGVETEIFIHGALCICYSGQCLMSSMIGGRSGNRGRCAQPCRLPYTLIDRASSREKNAYIMSPKDICTLEDIKRIIESGTSSLKIEGRMKRPEYVAGVVDVYKRAVESVYEGRSFDFEDENKKLMQLFNREGFSKAYMLGNVGKDMMAYNFPKNTGILLGKAMKNSIVDLSAHIGLGDGVRIGEGGFTVSKILKDGKEVEEAFNGDKVKLMPSNYSAGDTLYKTSDTELLNSLEHYYKNFFERKVELPLQVSFKTGEPIALSTLYKDNEFSVIGEVVQTALKKPLDKERITESFTKSGDTAFKFNSVNFKEFEEGFLPVSSLNSVRRELIEKIEKHIISSSRRNLNDTIKSSGIKARSEQIPKAVVVVSTLDQIKAFMESGINEALAVDIFKRQSSLSLEDLKTLNYDNLYLRVPNIIKEEFNSVCSIIDKAFPYIKGLVTSNLGVINRFKDKIDIIGDYKLNIFNSDALKFYNKFVKLAPISVELNKKEIEAIGRKTDTPVQIKIYGKEELMVSEYCPIGSVFGGKSSCENCKENCGKGDFLLKDRMGEDFILRTDKFCRSYIYNNVATNLLPHLEELKKIGITSYRLDFIDENYENTFKVLQAFKENKWTYEYINFTRGHYKRGVE
jgi:putative protease